jgi:glyceraldehyde-3-phosphate dehydrogenase/erythrose-4-phosphate dehydrogenase
MTNVAINGLGRIGRATMKIILEDSRFNLVAVNDIVSTANRHGVWPVGERHHRRRYGIADRRP